MLRREARILARLAPHPAIVPIYETGSIDGRAFIALEYLSHSLETALFRYSAGLPLAHALAMGIDIARALGHAHAHGVIHRDVKPGSILLDRVQRSVRLSDFNLAAMLDEESGTVSSGANGTYRYMSPEQRAGLPLTPASDVYTLGVTLRELLLGSGESGVDRLPGAVASCIGRALAQEPSERYGNGRAFAAALREAATPALDAVSVEREQAS